MKTQWLVPTDLPFVHVPEKIGDLGRAVITAGIWADSYLERALKDPAAKAELERSVGHKDGADVVTMLDPMSEAIMARIMQQSGYQGGIFGEEGLIVNPTHPMTLVLDGLDGTEAARSRPAGIDSAYGPSAGIFLDNEDVITPLCGAVYLPRQKRGFIGSPLTGLVLEFQVELLDGRKEIYEVSGVQEVPAFDHTRTDVKYLLCLFLGKEEKFPEWVGNLYRHANLEGQQNILHATGSQVDQLSKLVRECGDRSFHLGPSAAVAARDTRLHDIMGLAPAVLALGGVVGNMEGAQLGRDVEFLPEEYQRGKNPLAQLKEDKMIAKVPIGPVISAHNEMVYNHVINWMRGLGYFE